MANVPESSNRNPSQDERVESVGQLSDPEFLVRQIPWVRHLAQQIHSHLPKSVPIDDLVGAGIMGLLRASRSFDETRHVEFQCYARTRVRGAILDSLRENDWAPRSLRHKGREVSDAYYKLSASLGRFPSDVELAEKLGMNLPDLQELARDLNGLKISSLDDIPANSFGAPVRDLVAGPEDNIPYNRCLRAEIETLLGDAIARMSEAARRVLVHYYYDGMTMKEVGSMLGVGESRVSQIHKHAIKKLREVLKQAIERPLDDEEQYPRTGRIPVAETGNHESHIRNGINECYGK